ncbi:MAG: alpha-amylase family protein [Bryobacterales bacterium]|nr:alpha-amylase family protein [Bryobacterales bacterium]
MPSPASIRLLALAMLSLCLSASISARAQLSFAVTCEAPGWQAVFATFALSQIESAEEADIRVLCGDAPAANRAELDGWLSPHRVLILEGQSPIAASYGFVASGAPAASVRNVKDRRAEELLIVWQRPMEIVPTAMPQGAKVLMEERWSGAPLVALLPTPQGAVLWVAVPPGDSGFDRFPLLANALAEAGFVAPFRSRNLWAFFDSAYRQRVDLDYLTARWERFGIAGLHVSAWQHWEADEQKDAWLRKLIEACHRRGILVYAWMEFPHVSERFWAEHPECREQTALGQDAQLDWRKLINLSDAACSERVKQGAASLLSRFSWDGVNLAEIYYESLEGVQNPARFTPMNQTIRRQFEAEAGFDPATLFDAASPRHLSRNVAGLQRFLAWRRHRIGELHEDWLRFVAAAQTPAGELHVVVTQIDDRFDDSVRDNLGADSNAILQLMHQYRFTFLVEDPATVWHLGPARYTGIARAYAKVTPYPERLAVDINIFPRYQEVYPTKRQTGVELYRLVHAAANAFPRVALYFEHVLATEDLPFLAAAALPAVRASRQGDSIVVESAQPIGVEWRGPVRVNGRPWAAKDESTVWLPRGRHTLEAGGEDPALILRRFSGEVRHVHSAGRRLEFHYASDTRAIATFDEAPARLWVDGQQLSAPVYEAVQGYYLLLPAGEHLVAVEAAFTDVPSQ